MTRRTPKYRPERLATLIRESLAEALVTELKDPRVGFVTITGASVSPDGSHATIRVSPMGSAEEKKRAMEGLSSARGFLRTHLARKLNMRNAPQLHIVLDDSLEYANKIDTILRDLERGESIS